MRFSINIKVTQKRPENMVTQAESYPHTHTEALK